MSTTLYTLLPNSTSTRVLTLHHSAESEPIHASLSVIDIRKYPKFDAVSYTWGTDLNSQDIVVDGHTLRIRQNLHDFLLRLRREKQKRPIWIDAISISQTDLKEKGQQVQMIGDIFEAAKRVLMWTGQHGDGSRELFSNIHAKISLGGRMKGALSALSSRSGSEPRGKVDSEGHSRLLAWINFINRPYFGRLWIIQEIALAQSLVVYCGDSSVDWHTLIHTESGLSGVRPYLQSVSGAEVIHKGGDTRYDQTGAGMLDIITALRQSVQKDNVVGEERPVRELSMLSREFQYAECFDRRDRVFALLSLERLPESWSDCKSIPVHYTISVPDLFFEICEYRLRVTKPPVPGDRSSMVQFEDIRKAMNWYGQPILLESRDVELVASLIEGLLLTAAELDTIFSKILTNMTGPDWKWWCYFSGLIICTMFVEGEKWKSPSKRESTAMLGELQEIIKDASLLEAIDMTREHLRGL